jgi:hypothetical protein
MSHFSERLIEATQAIFEDDLERLLREATAKTA